MRIAFYAPMKPPDHAVPSGDRRMADLLIRAMRSSGHWVELASRFCSRDGVGAPARQQRLARIGGRLAERALRRYQVRPASQRPELWFTYHLYYKAPDWLGPAVTRGLGIPYVVAEASLAPKRAGGPWDLGHRATEAALAAAAAVIALNPDDVGCLPQTCRIRRLAPFLDPEPGRAARAAREEHRAAAAARHGLDPARPWIVTVAMMRAGDKLASYRLLAEALAGLRHASWQLLVVGDGPARGEVAQAFAALETPGGREHVRFLGAVAEDELPALLAACDLYAWPAIGEAYGMALLEAQAAGLPAVAGRSGGVASIVEDGTTGRLVPCGDVAGFRAALDALLGAPARRQAMGEAALAKVARDHGLARATAELDAILRDARGPA